MMIPDCTNYGARYYNPRISTWYGVDPLAEKMASWSPYVYTLDNPVRFTDPDGMAPQDQSETDCCSILLQGAARGITILGTGGYAGGAFTAGLASLPFVIAGVAYAGNIKQKEFLIQRGNEFSALSNKEEKDKLLHESFPVAEKDNLIVRTIPAAGVGKIKILNVSKRSNNKLQPESQAYGDHSTFETDDNGDIYKYETYEKTKTSYFNPKKRFDGGKKDGSAEAAHDGVKTPHINFRDNKIPVRKPTSQEYPRNNRFKGKY